MEDTRTDLYRHFDKEGRLLYVGISFRAIVRQAAHSNASPWWNDVATITVDRFPSRRSASAAEKRAVEEEKPLYNKHFGKKPFRYRSKRQHGHTIELPGAADMAQAVVDWYISLTRSQTMPKALRGLADKFDQSTDAGKGYALAIRAIEQLHRDAMAEGMADKKQQREQYKTVVRRIGKKSGPPTLVEKLEKKDPKRLKAIRKDLKDPTVSWRDMQKKYGYAVATLRRHFLEERQAYFGELAAKDDETK